MAVTRQIFVTQPDVAWTITIPRGMKIPVTCELIGGGGGGGGNDAQPGGNAAGGQYLKTVFDVVGGDQLTFIVGGGGGAGQSGRGNAAGGTAGTSMIKYITSIFNLRTVTANPKVYAKTNAAWGSFINNYAVWESNSLAASFTRSYIVNFPITGFYQFKAAAIGTAEISVDGVLAAGSTKSLGDPTYFSVPVSAGVHTVTVSATNTRGAGGVALDISRSPDSSNDDFTGSMSGGRGGNAGAAGSSGAGGGGGGASVLLINGQIAAIAGGGGGAGGGGASSAGLSANNTPIISRFYNGQSGQQKRGDGGGGGGSGGGFSASSGGTESAGDSGGNAGASADVWYPSDPYGQNLTNFATGRNAFATLEYGTGGSPGQTGKAGYARFVFDVSFASYKSGNVWKDVFDMYVKDAGDWKPVVGYIKQNGVWQPLARRELAIYRSGAGIVGADYRDLAMVPAPVVTYSSSGGGSDSYSGGWNYSAVGDFNDGGYGTYSSDTSFA
tara:strand:- start:10299 stop:11789 length:1491 start_codon:yes stop_codon:yes gene_type:complete